MPYKLEYFRDALLDVKEAKMWYKAQQPGLEKRFAESIKTTILTLPKNPLAHSLRYKNIRIAHPKIFPYGIHFYVDDVNQKIVIIAIIHNKRHPIIAQKRVSQ